jgi:hypothetical protein
MIDLGVRWGWVVDDEPRPLYPSERMPVPGEVVGFRCGLPEFFRLLGRLSRNVGA